MIIPGKIDFKIKRSGRIVNSIHINQRTKIKKLKKQT